MSARHMAKGRIGLRGLPSRLPDGEELLWQGAPSARALALHAFRLPWVAAYFGLILVASAVLGHHGGGTAPALSMALLHRVLLSAIPLVLIALYAWAVSANAVYSITTKRVILHIGIGLPIDFNVPFARIESADLRLYGHGAGDIALRLRPGDRLSYVVLWPHARPWRLARPEPTLRCIAGAADASAILAQAVGAYDASAATQADTAAPRRAVRLHATRATRSPSMAV